MEEKYTSEIQNVSDTHAVCIHTDQVYDSCRSKECLENLRVYLTDCGQELLNNSVSVKARKAEVVWVFSDVEEVPFQQGYYTVDLKFFFKITLDVYTGIGHPQVLEGLATYNKKVVLFGSEGSAKVFQSRYKEDSFDPQLWQKTNMPKAVVEVVDPVALSTKVVDPSDHCGCSECTDISAIPECVCRIFDEALTSGDNCRKLFVTLGLFSIIKLERNVQLLIPSYDFCVPNKECVGSTEDNPCDLFEQLEFPIDEFFPPRQDSCEC